MPSLPLACALASCLLVGCTTFSDAEVSATGGTSGAMSGSSGYAGSLPLAGAGGVASAGGTAGTSGAGGQAGSVGPAGAGGGAGEAGQGGSAGAVAGAGGDGGAAGSPAGAGGSAGGQVAACGDGTRNGTEECDGQDVGAATCSSAVGEMATGVLGCSTSCSLVTSGCRWCGNGKTEPGEECDDGNAIDSDACTSACKAPRCGDGIVQPGEECDDGTNNASGVASCSSACQKTCGSGPLSTGFKVGTTCYLLVIGQVSWDEARSKCDAQGSEGHFELSSVETLGEFTTVASKLKTLGLAQEVWLGGQRVDGTLTWLSGEPIGFTDGQPPWASNQPSSSLDCVYMQSKFLMDASLFTDGCADHHATLCEW